MPYYSHTLETPDGSDVYDPSAALLARQIVFNPGGSGSLTAVTIVNQGFYSGIVTLTTAGPGSGATFVTHMLSKVVVVVSAGTGYVPGDTITLTGGTFGTAIQVTVADTQVVSLAINAIGMNYHTGDNITLSGGTASDNAVITVASTQLLTANVSNGGRNYNIADTVTLSGGTSSVQAVVNISQVALFAGSIENVGSNYTVGDTITLSGGTQIVAPVFQVTQVRNGQVAGIQQINGGILTAQPMGNNFIQASSSGSGLGFTYNNGVYTVVAVTLNSGGTYTIEPTTAGQTVSSGFGTGIQFNSLVFSLKSVSITDPGTYSVNPTSFIQGGTSGTGSGGTFNTVVMGANLLTLTTPGDYTVLPTNPVAQGSTSGSGINATFNVISWGVLSISVTGGGSGYNQSTGLIFSGAGELTPATGTITVSSTGASAIVPVSILGLPTDGTGQGTYTVICNPGQLCDWYVAQNSKTSSGFTVTLVPVSGGVSIAQGQIDVQVSA